MFTRQSKRGFTFIELAISISIIGVLSLVVLSGVNSSRKSARVAQRVSDMKRVQSALDLYYAKNRSYPYTGGTASWRSTCTSWGGYTRDNVIVDINNGNKLVPTYLLAMPEDPQKSTNPSINCYLYTSNGTDYAFLVHDVPELSAGNSGATYAKYPEFFDSVRPTWAWKVSSPGGIGF